tara:strand:- start:4119 stop:4457 length:339 start_codon:yes stop_codon:yes gene_type:complete
MLGDTALPSNLTWLQTLLNETTRNVDMLKNILDAFPEAPFIVLDGLDKAVIGCRFINEQSHLEYSFEKIIEILCSRDGMTYEEAVEFYYFNIEGLGGMKNMPIFYHEDDELE